MTVVEKKTGRPKREPRPLFLKLGLFRYLGLYLANKNTNTNKENINNDSNGQLGLYKQ